MGFAEVARNSAGVNLLSAMVMAATGETQSLRLTVGNMSANV